MLSQYYHSSVDEEDAKMVLEKVGLSHRLTHLPSQLSGGEQQRVCIARALINNPELLLADEPTGNLDEANEQIVLQTLQKLKNEGKTIVLITHNPDLATCRSNPYLTTWGVKMKKNLLILSILFLLNACSFEKFKRYWKSWRKKR